MKNKKLITLIIILVFTLTIIFLEQRNFKISAQQVASVQSNTVITQVGNPTTPKPNTSSAPATNQAVSCLVPGGRISTHSYEADPKTGHCSPGYPLEGRCTSTCTGGIGASRRAKAIDVPTNGGNVILPTIAGQTVNWSLVVSYPIDLVDGGGTGYAFEAIVDGNKWTLDMLHMGATSLTRGNQYPSGSIVGKSVIDHVHTTIGENVKNDTRQGNPETDCDSGWLPSDFMCQ